MPRLNDTKPIKRYHIILYQEDYDFIKALFGPMNASEGIRKILHKSLKTLRDQSQQRAAKPMTLEEIGEELE